MKSSDPEWKQFPKHLEDSFKYERIQFVKQNILYLLYHPTWLPAHSGTKPLHPKPDNV